MLLDVRLVNGTSGTATVDQCFRRQGLPVGDRFDGHGDGEVPRGARMYRIGLQIS